LTAVNWVKCNAIYLFYNEVKTDATGASVEGYAALVNKVNTGTVLFRSNRHGV
jgi:hypothetical protein